MEISLTGRGRAMTTEETEERYAKWKRRAILLASALFGIALISLSHFCPWEISRDIMKEIGVAFLIAAIIGATIDSILKVELLRDVFFATFKYAFHPALQNEILRIMRYRLICDNHALRVKIEIIDSEAVRVTCEMRRRIRNIGSSSAKIAPSLHIDEWGFPQEKSSIIECKAEPQEGNTILARQHETTDDTIKFQGRETSLAPKKYVIMTTKWTEVRRHNDSIYIHLSHPTIDPEIEVPPVPGFKIVRSFGSASEEIEEILSSRQVLKGTYLPFHYMVIRWWPESHVAAPRS
jgi:hypothetical protein